LPAYIERRHEAGPDPDLVRTAKAGDEAAFEQLLRPLIDRFACVILRKQRHPSRSKVLRDYTEDRERTREAEAVS